MMAAGGAHWAPRGRPPGPKCDSLMPASSSVVASAPASKTVMAIEQQMSAECMPGWMAFSAATTPPTGMVPGVFSAGQASGMMAPARTVGTRISSAMWASTAATFAASASPSGTMLRWNGTAPVAWSGSPGGGASAATIARTASSGAPAFLAASAAAMAWGNQAPGAKPQPTSVSPVMVSMCRLWFRGLAGRIISKVAATRDGGTLPRADAPPSGAESNRSAFA